MLAEELGADYTAVQPSQDILASYTSDAYPIMVPERKGPITNKMLEKFVEAEMEDEYCALPFNHDPEYAVSQTTLLYLCKAFATPWMILIETLMYMCNHQVLWILNL